MVLWWSRVTMQISTRLPRKGDATFWICSILITSGSLSLLIFVGIAEPPYYPGKISSQLKVAHGSSCVIMHKRGRLAFEV